MKRKYEAEVHQAVVEPTNERIAELARLGSEIYGDEPTPSKPFYIKWTQNIFILLFMVIANVPVLLVKLIVLLVGAIVMGIGQLLFMAGGYVVILFRLILIAGVLMLILTWTNYHDMPWYIGAMFIGIGIAFQWLTEWFCNAIYTVGDIIKDFGWGMPLIKISYIK